MTAGILASNQLSFKMNLCGTFKRSVRYTFMAELKYLEAGMLSVCKYYSFSTGNSSQHCHENPEVEVVYGN